MIASKYVKKVHEEEHVESWYKVLRKSITFVCMHNKASRQFQLVNFIDFVTVLSIIRLQLH